MSLGLMPNLADVCRRGCRAVLESTPIPITPMAWTTLATGRSAGYHGLPLLGPSHCLRRLARENACLEVLIALPEAGAQRQAGLVSLCEELRLRWSIVTWLFGSMASGLRLDLIGAIPLVGPRASNIEGLNYLLKRCLDLTLGTAIFVIALPVLALASLEKPRDDPASPSCRVDTAALFGPCSRP